MRPQRQSRLNFEIPDSIQRHLKITAAKLGLSIKDLATQAIEEKLEALDMQEDIEIYDRKMEKYNKGELKTISHEEMMKKLDLE